MKIFILTAMSLDGFIGKSNNQRSFDWTSREDKRWHVKKTKEAGAVIFGRKTFETFNKPLPGRLNLIYSKTKQEEFAKKTTEELKQLKGQTQLYYTKLSPKEIEKKLDSAGYAGLSISGGPSVYQVFFDSGVVDELFITIEPVLFGHGISMFKNMKSKTKLKFIKTHDLNENTIVLEYKVIPFQK